MLLGQHCYKGFSYIMPGVLIEFGGVSQSQNDATLRRHLIMVASQILDCTLDDLLDTHIQKDNHMLHKFQKSH